MAPLEARSLDAEVQPSYRLNSMVTATHRWPGVPLALVSAILFGVSTPLATYSPGRSCAPRALTSALSGHSSSAFAPLNAWSRQQSCSSAKAVRPSISRSKACCPPHRSRYVRAVYADQSPPSALPGEEHRPRSAERNPRSTGFKKRSGMVAPTGPRNPQRRFSSVTKSLPSRIKWEQERLYQRPHSRKTA
jgi:hypothetical protein